MVNTHIVTFLLLVTYTLLEQINTENKRKLKKNWREEGAEEEMRKWVDPGEYQTKTIANKDNHVEISQVKIL